MKTICDRCSNYRVSPGGCVEQCNEMMGSVVIPYLSKYYFDERNSGDKNFCKAFKKL